MKDTKIKIRVTLLIHIALWVCFLLLPYFFFPDFKELPDRMSNRILISHFISAVYLIAFYYLNTGLFIPKFLFHSKWVTYTLISLIFFIAYMYVPKYVTDKVTGGPGGPPDKKNEQIAEQKDKKNLAPNTVATFKKDSTADNNNTGKADRSNEQRRNNFRNNPFFKLYFGPYAIFLLVFTIGTSISVMQRWRTLERNTEDIEREKLNTELSFLKSQVNPHFFFNTLNNIYSLAVVGSELTAPAVLQLSSIMRYILTETQSDKVPLQNEIEFIKNFIDLQLVRLTDKVHIDFAIEGVTDDKLVAPMLFIPFVENAFKYGVSTKEKTSIDIKLIVAKKNITFFISNTVIKAENAIHDTTGIGINNVKRRLELLYPDKHTLIVKEENNLFTVQLDLSI